jgi:hypothetical protein
MIRSFDTDPGWLGPEHLRSFDATESPTQRLEQASAARGGGTMPDWMVNRLHELAAKGRLCIQTGVPIATADTIDVHYELTLADNTTITGDLLWLATGTIPDLAACERCHRCSRTLRRSMVIPHPTMTCASAVTRSM